MINQYHARVIDELRQAAADKSEVFELLRVVASCFPYLVNGDSTFTGGEKERCFLIAVQNAFSFASIDVGGDE